MNKRQRKTILPADIPAADTIIDYGDGTMGPLMFHFGTEAENFKEVAHEQGFDVATIHLEADAGAADLFEEYENGLNSLEVLSRWNPGTPDGWQFGGKNDTEDGPVAIFIRKRDLTTKHTG